MSSKLTPLPLSGRRWYSILSLNINSFLKCLWELAGVSWRTSPPSPDTGLILKWEIFTSSASGILKVFQFFSVLKQNREMSSVFFFHVPPCPFCFFSVRKVKRKKKKERKGNRKHKWEIILKWIIYFDWKSCQTVDTRMPFYQQCSGERTVEDK